MSNLRRTFTVASFAHRTFVGCLSFFLLCALALVSCGGDSASESGSAQETSDVDALRALPYLGFSSENAAAGNDGVVHYDPDRAYNGYTLYTHRTLCLAELIDMEGNVVNSWRDPLCRHWSNAELLPNGDLVVAGMHRVSRDAAHEEYARKAYVVRLDWNGKLVWETPINAHHDVDHTPDGGFATLTMGWRRIPEWHRRVDVRDNGIARMSSDGEVLEEVSMFELLTSDPAVLELQKIKPSDAYGREAIDLFHGNSVEWMHHEHLVGRHPIYDLDNVIISLRHQDTVAVVNWPSKKLVWAWGNGEISGPHDATVLESGNVMIFDNGLGRDWSRVIEVDPQTREIVWEYKAPEPTDFYTRSRGGNERLPNGNTLITNSDSAQIFEVAPNGEFVWEFFSRHKNEDGRRATMVRAHRYETDFILGLLEEPAPAE